MKTMLLVLGVLSGADAATTCHALSTGRFYEAAALTTGRRPSCGRVVALKATAVGLESFVALKLNKKHPKVAKIAVSAVITVNGVTVGWNVNQLWRHR